VARIAEGIRAKDLEGLRPIYATDVVSFDVEPPPQHFGVEAKLKNWANACRDADTALPMPGGCSARPVSQAADVNPPLLRRCDGDDSRLDEVSSVSTVRETGVHRTPS
jgi:hypothetical protein